MRGFLPARPCLSTAKAFLAGAAILAGAASQASSAPRSTSSGAELAMAVPRLSSAGDGGVALPRPLPPTTVRLLRTAFADAAAPVIGLDAEPLLGHVLAARLLAPGFKAAAEDLRAWLARFADQPDAPALHALLLTRLPRGAVPPPAPALPPFTAALPGDDVETAGPPLSRSPGLDAAVRAAARLGQFDRAVHLVRRTSGISVEYGALLRAELAQMLFSQGSDAQALRLAEAAHHQARGAVGLAPWIGGLAAWRLGRPETARTLFEAAYRAPIQPPGRKAAAAFWAARAALLTRGHTSAWMRRAAQDPRTFYGLLARRILRQPIAQVDEVVETLGEADVEAVAATPGGRRAFGLLQVGEPTRAAAELRLLWSETREQPGFGRSVLLVARAAGLSDLVQQLEALTQPAIVRLPTKRLRPAGGFRFDPALVYAMTRIESNFDAAAVSPAGARGLMQLMPRAVEVALTGGRSRPIRLHDPATNLDLGQRYLSQLTQYDSVGTDLIRLLVAYNAGPGNFAKFQETIREDDPLLYIECLPLSETRAYVPKALAYSWLYAAQLGLPSPSLDQLAVGDWPSIAHPQREAARH